MSIAPLDEILVSITNIIRKSEYAHTMLMGSEEAEEKFNSWQKKILHYAGVVHGTWHNDNMDCDIALTSIEKAFEDILTPVKL